MVLICKHLGDPAMRHNDEKDLLFLYANEGIMVSDAKGMIVRINPACAQLFGYTENELVGHSVEELVPPRLVHRHRSEREAFHDRPHVRSFGQQSGIIGLHKDGHEIPLEISLSPFEDGDQHFTIAFVVDNTYRRQSEQKLRDYAEQLERDVRNRTLILQEAVEQLERTKAELGQALTKEKELSHLKSRFVSIASHEFRTPLATILSSLSLVRKYADLGEIEKRDKHIERIKGSISSLNDILNDFLSLSKLEEGAVELKVTEVYWPDFLKTIVDELRPISKESQEIVVEHSGCDHIHIDIKLIKAVLINLLTNALKYSAADSHVELQSDCDSSHLRIHIRDHGIGIPAEDLAHVFERFFRAHNVMHIQGTGLGLNIVARFVELMGGRITIDSTQGTGTHVQVEIPL